MLSFHEAMDEIPLGISLGGILSFALPPQWGLTAISYIEEIALGIGGYAVVGTLIAGLPFSVFRLAETHYFPKIFLQAIAFLESALLSLRRLDSAGVCCSILLHFRLLLKAAL